MKLAVAPTPDIFSIDLLADFKQLRWMLHPAHRRLMSRNPTDLGFLQRLVLAVGPYVNATSSPGRSPGRSSSAALALIPLSTDASDRKAWLESALRGGA
ncbi:hypothetical protein [Streptomyces sp. NPDC005533]|uniref:hypothetical protein n=1 Tax=Streptomyces sp. NPDC005533 TaxID=3364723 RepID=UPI0036D01585